MKSVRIWSYSGPHFPAFGLNTDQNNYEYGHFLRSVMHFVSSLRRPIWFLHHCVKSGQIWSYFWSAFSCFSPNTGKYRPEITPYLDTFHAVHFTYIWTIFPKSFCCFDNLIYLTTSEYFIVSMKFTQLSLDFCFKTLNVDNLKIFIKNQHFLEHNCSKVFLTGINIFNCLLEPYQHLKCLRKV